MIEYDVIGYYTPPEVVVLPAATIPFLVNATELDPELAQYQVFPDSPVRLFWDGPTIFLSFPDEETWISYKPEESIVGE